MLVSQVVTSETLRCFTAVGMLALYSCMCTYIYPAYIIYYSQLKRWGFLFLTKNSLLDKIKISDLNPNIDVEENDIFIF